MTSPLANIYARLPVSFTHGQGVWLWDAQGRKYLDALAGSGCPAWATRTPGWWPPSASRPPASFIPRTSTKSRSRPRWRRA